MKQYYRILCIWVVVALLLGALAPATAAQEPQGAVEPQYVPPRPDLAAVLQQQGALPKPGNGLDAAMSPAAAEAAFQEYLAKKLGSNAFQDSSVQGRASGRSLQQAPPKSEILVVLAEYADLAHNNIPKPGTQNNTDWWVENFSESYYTNLFFGPVGSTPPSFATYIKEASDYDGASHGWAPTGTVITWTRVVSNAAQYGNDLAAGGVDNDLSDGADVYQLVRDAADTLVGYTPPGGWDNYVTSSFIDYFVIVHAGKGQEAGGGALGDNAVWSVQGTLDAPYRIGETGPYVYNFVVVAEDSPVGTIVHEMGHLFGLPDTWNPVAGLEVPGTRQKERVNDANVGEPSPTFWDPMAYGCWLGIPLGIHPASMTSWERIDLGWLTPEVWTLGDMPASAYLSQLETPPLGHKALKIELTPRVYVAPHSATHMRQAPDPTDMTSPSILSHTFQITPCTSAYFTFYQWYDLETDLDVGYVEIAAPSGSAFTTVFTVTGSSSGWAYRTLNLGAYIGQTIDIRFRLERDPNIKKLGWFLDDFALIQDGYTTWFDDLETSDAGPVQGAGGYEWDDNGRFPRNTQYQSDHYYLVEWRNDQAGFDIGLREAYHMVDMATGRAEYFWYNPGLLIWYANPIYERNWDNDVLLHPGEGFLLAVDAHPDPYLQSTGRPWRSRVQMQDATFRKTGTTYNNSLHDSAGVLRTFGGLPAVTYFLDWWSSYPYWRSSAPDNSAKTPEFGIKLEIQNENPDMSGALVRFSIDAADMRTSRKTVDKATAMPGEVLLYTIVLTNTGHADAQTIVVSDSAPLHSTYIPGSFTVTGSPSWAITEANGIRWQGTVSQTIPSLGIFHPVTITFQVRLDSVIDNGTVVENVAHVYEGDVPEVDLVARTTIISQPCLTSSTKTSSPTAVLAGDIVTYTIVLINTGTSGGTVLVTDCIPVCTTYVSGSFTTQGATQGSGGYNPQTNCITWSGYVPALGSTPVVTITFQVLVSRGLGYCYLITNQACLNDGYQQFCIGANTTVLQGPNLRESFKRVDKAVAAPGDRLQYSIVITNTGNRSASVTLSDTIPVSTSYVAGSLTCSGGSCATDGSSVHYTGTLGVGAMGVVTFSVDISSTVPNRTIITNTADIVEDGTKTYTRVVTTTVLSEPRLTNSVKTVTNTSVGYGGILTYTITLLNDGTQDTTVYMTDDIPTGTQYKPGSLSYLWGSGGYTSPSGPITWTGTITRGASITVSFAVNITLTGTGVITNCALINDSVLQTPFYRCVETRIAAVQVVSPTQEVYCGDLIDVPIAVVGVSDLQGYQVGVNFSPAALQIVSITPYTWFVPYAYFNYYYSNTAGTSMAFSALNAQPTGKSGSGTLYTIRFRTIGSGPTTIWITGSLLSNTPAPGFSPIPHNAISATININPRDVQGVAYLQGRTNHSGATVVALVGSTPVVTTTTDSGGNYTLCPPVGSGQNFTIRISKRGYLTAEKLVPVPGSGTVPLGVVTLPGGDVAGGNTTITTTYPCTATWTIGGVMDAKVNVVDLAFVGARFLKQCGDREWEWEPYSPFDPSPPGDGDPDGDYCYPTTSNAKLADINEDCVVDIFDLVLVGYNFGRTGPITW